MWSPPIWSLSMVDLLWSVPPNSTKELRALKRHLSDGGVVYGRSTLPDTSYVVTFTTSTPQQPRTMESGVLLSANIVNSSEPLNIPEDRVDKAGQLFATREGLHHSSTPSIQDFNLVTKPLTQLHSDVEQLSSSSMLVSSAAWMFSAVSNVTKSCIFFLIQGNLLRLVWAYPVVQIPVVLASTSVIMLYYNMTVWDTAQWIGSVLFSFSYFLLYLQSYAASCFCLYNLK